jgi:archaemetzincin
LVLVVGLAVPLGLGCGPSGAAEVAVASSPPQAPAGAVVPTAVESGEQPAPSTKEVAPPPPGPRAQVVLVTLGDFDADLVDAVEEGIAAEFDVAVDRVASRPLPLQAWYAPRKRYRADVIIDVIPALIADRPESTRILALTTKDISTTNGKFQDWGIFGLGNMPGPAAVVSSFRLRKNAKDRAHLTRRVVITAIHEVGHTLGLDHCTEAAERCPMQDAEGSITNTDTSTGHLGPECRAQLDREMPRMLTSP